jgi:1,4-dihydroxy-2-naphthoate octaprenyltransferase
LAAVIGFYLLLQKYLPLKEFVVAGLYTFGVLLPSWRLQTELISIDHILLVVQFFIVALANVLIFSWFEFEADTRDGHTSLATRWGKGLCTKLIIILSIVNICISVWMLMYSEYKVPTFIFLLMMGILMDILYFHSYFSKYARYRLLGDAVFFLSIFGLLQ